MMFGIILFWIQYIIAGILLYHILKCIYVKGDVDTRMYHDKYKKTDNDRKLKNPLWIIMIFLLVFTIPVINNVVYATYLFFKLYDENGDEYNKYYCKSVFTKEY